MKKFLFVLIFSIIEQTIQGQMMHLVYLEKVLLCESISQEEELLNSLGYETYNASTKGAGDSCRQQLTFRKEVKTSIKFHEEIILFRKCVQRRFFGLCRLSTRDSDLFYRLKKECAEDDQNILKKETIEDGFIVQDYKNKYTLYSFHNGSDKNGKIFFIDVVSLVKYEK